MQSLLTLFGLIALLDSAESLGSDMPVHLLHISHEKAALPSHTQ